MSANGRYIKFNRFSMHDGPGVRTTLFLKGCPLHCEWCHNPEAISLKPELAFFERRCIMCGSCAMVCPTGAHKFIDGKHILERELCTACGDCELICPTRALVLYGKDIAPREAADKLLEDRAFYEESGGGVTISGGEPLIQADFCAELLKILKGEGIHTAIDTCGEAAWESFEKVLPYTDLFLYDIKHTESEKHREHTGKGNERILDNLRRISEYGAAIEIRIPLIPGFNDDEENLNNTGKMLGGLKGIAAVRLLAYHTYAHPKYAAIARTDTMPDVTVPNKEDLALAAVILEKYGLNTIY